MDITVIGAGFVAATLSDALEARGCTVRMIAPTPELTGASGTTYAWLNSHRKRPDAYQLLNQIGLEFWRQEFGPRFPDHVHWCGHTALMSSEEHTVALRSRVEHLSSLGYPASITAASHLQDLPVPVSPEAECAEFPEEGYCDVRAIHAALMESLLQRARFTFIPGAAERITATGITLSSGETLESDHIVVAAGNGSAPLLEDAGFPLPMVSADVGGPAWGFLIEARVPSHGLERLITSDELNVRPIDEDRLLVQALDLDRDAGAPESPSARVLAEYRRRLVALLNREDIVIARASTGHRVIPIDGLTVAGPTQGRADDRLWTIVTHSGITLGPWLSDVIAAEISEGRLQSALAGFRPTRFSTQQSSGSEFHAPRQPGEQ